MPKIIDTVGSSTAIGGIASGVGVGDRLADRDVLDAREADDVAGRGLGDLDAFQPLEREQLGHAGRLRAPSSLSTTIRSLTATWPLKMRVPSAAGVAPSGYVGRARRSGDDVRRGAAGALGDAGERLGGEDQVGERVGGGEAEAAGVVLVALDVDAQRRAGGAGAREAEDDAGAALEEDADALVRADRAVDRVV